MTMTVTISDEAEARAKELIGQGHFNSLEQVMETAMGHLAYGYGYRRVDENDEIDPDAEADALVGVSDEDREAIREGLRDGKEGRVLTIDQVFDPLLAELRVKAERRLTGTDG